MHCPACGQVLDALPTDELKPLRPTSVYAVGKRDQEETCLVVGRAYNIPTIALRYFNTYGQRQALSNPYTGAVAIFSACLLDGRRPIVYEDGLQSRDFTHVSDIVQANVRALESTSVEYGTFNVGTGVRTSLLSMLQTLCSAMGREFQADIQQKFRQGDIRHCFADISAARGELGFEPAMPLEEGLRDLLPWLESARQAETGRRVEQAQRELIERGLTT
jgi:dTDP-L-rhamnose 4-epimerase